MAPHAFGKHRYLSRIPAVVSASLRACRYQPFEFNRVRGFYTAWNRAQRHKDSEISSKGTATPTRCEPRQKMRDAASWLRSLSSPLNVLYGEIGLKVPEIVGVGDPKQQICYQALAA
jgi:hypothetical protein